MSSLEETNSLDLDAFSREVENKISEDVTKNNKKSRNGIKSKLCSSCKKIFRGKKDFKTHLCSIQCKACGKSLKSHKSMEDHLQRSHSIGKKLKCEICEDEVYDMRKHKRQFHREKQSCPDCGKAVKNMKYHFQTIHGPPDLKKFICKICEKRFLLKEKLLAHSKVHSEEREFECKFKCGYASRTLGNLKKHESSIRACERLRKRSIRQAESIIKDYGKVDSGVVKVNLLQEEDPLLVDEKTPLYEKGKKYREDPHLTRNNVILTNDQKLKEDVENIELDEGCVENIIKEAEISEHREIIQTDAKDEKIKTTYPSNCCPFCGKDFEKIEHHILVSHMGIKVFQYNCKLCGKEFETKETLVVHKALHLNKTDYWCQFSCGFSIKSKTLLKVHEKDIHQINHLF